MKNALNFLRKIKKNNNTEWMHAHKDEYLLAKNEFEFLVQELITRIKEWDERLPSFEPKHCTFRINRDIRFSENKKPYKENFGAYMGYGGKKSGLPGYYFHLSATEVFAAGGVWYPEPKDLIKIRRYISRNGDELQRILNNKTFKKTFGGLNDENALKRPPKGFEADDPYIEFLKLKSFTVFSPVPLTDVLKPGLGKTIDKHFRFMKPLNEFLYQAFTHP